LPLHKIERGLLPRVRVVSFDTLSNGLAFVQHARKPHGTDDRSGKEHHCDRNYNAYEKGRPGDVSAFSPGTRSTVFRLRLDILTVIFFVYWFNIRDLCSGRPSGCRNRYWIAATGTPSPAADEIVGDAEAGPAFGAQKLDGHGGNLRSTGPDPRRVPSRVRKP
jgi:hypothetical protein